MPALGKELTEGFYAVGGMEIPYRDTATGKAKEWAETYFKTYNMEPNTQSALGYNDIMTFAHYAKLAGKDLTGQKFLAAMESGRRLPGHLQLAAGEVLADRSTCRPRCSCSSRSRTAAGLC